MFSFGLNKNCGCLFFTLNPVQFSFLGKHQEIQFVLQYLIKAKDKSKGISKD